MDFYGIDMRNRHIDRNLIFFQYSVRGKEMIVSKRFTGYTFLNAFIFGVSLE